MNEFGFVEDTVDDLGFVEDSTPVGVDTRIDMDAWQPVPEGEKDFGDQLLAGVSGFADTVTMGLGDETAAGLEAFADWAGGSREDNLYQKHYDKGQAARDQLAGQYPTEFEQGEWTGMGTQMLAPSGVTKAGLARAGQVKGAADTMIGKGAGKVKDVILDSPIKNYPKAAAFVKGSVPSSVGDLAAMGAGAVASPISPITGAAGGLATKRAVEAGASHFVKRAQHAKVADVKMGEKVASLQNLMAKMDGMAPDSGAAAALRRGLPKLEKIAKESYDLSKSDYTGRAAGAVYDLNQKFGPYMKELAKRGNDAFISNVFIKQQQDPEFRAMLKAAKMEAAKASEEN